MNATQKRSVTRKETYALIAGVVALALACVVMSWGLLSLVLHRSPVITAGVVSASAPLIILCAGSLLGVMLWQQTLVLLRGNLGLPWAQILSSSCGALVLWCLGGAAFGMGFEDTWLSPFTYVFAGIWGMASLLTWVLFLHRIYGGRMSRLWPWEKEQFVNLKDETSAND